MLRNMKAEEQIVWMHFIKKKQAKAKVTQPPFHRCWQRQETYGSETKDSSLLTATAQPKDQLATVPRGQWKAGQGIGPHRVVVL